MVYGLDRVKEMTVIDEKFVKDPEVTLEDLFGNVLGVTSSKADVRTVRLEATATQAKYFRALPLHHSQEEEVHDRYSIFTYRLKLNYELVHEVMALGEAVKVLDPPELKAMVVTELENALKRYRPTEDMP